MNKIRKDKGKKRPNACGERRKTWKYGPDKRIKDQNLVFLKHRAQAKYRGELYDLTREQFNDYWNQSIPFTTLTFWDNRGRTKGSYIMKRIDNTLPWSEGNIRIVLRHRQSE